MKNKDQFRFFRVQVRNAREIVKEMNRKKCTQVFGIYLFLSGSPFNSPTLIPHVSVFTRNGKGIFFYIDIRSNYLGAL